MGDRFSVLYGFMSMTDRAGVPVLFKNGEPFQRLDTNEPAYRDSFCGWSEWRINDRTAESAAATGCTGTCVDWAPGRIEHACSPKPDDSGLLGPWCTSLDAVQGES